MCQQTWEDIKSEHGPFNAILLGNGASIALCDSFKYTSLYEKACELALLDENVQAIFAHMNDTHDFELVMQVLSTASYINLVLDVEDDKTTEAYNIIQNALIESLREIHPSRDTTSPFAIDNAGVFLKDFKTILSLNYDLLLYWIILCSNDICDEHKHLFKDCFLSGVFKDAWGDLREPSGSIENVSLVFYPHGNLALVKNLYGRENKIHMYRDSLLKTITDQWSNQKTPLFVSEGSSPQKLSAIKRSSYLQKVYDEVLPKLEGTIVIYGWSFAANDRHILTRICRGTAVKKLLVSIHPDDQDTEIKMSLIKQGVHSINPEIDIVFFSTDMPGVWIND